MVVLVVVLPQRSTRHRGRRERRQQRQAAWMFLIACIVVFGLMWVFGPDELRPGQHRALGVTYSVLVGFLAYFSGGSTRIIAELELPTMAKVGICFGIAMVAAALVFGIWEFGLSPVTRSGE